jgi:hypothetical protein
MPLERRDGWDGLRARRRVKDDTDTVPRDARQRELKILESEKIVDGH